MLIYLPFKLFVSIVNDFSGTFYTYTYSLGQVTVYILLFLLLFAAVVVVVVVVAVVVVWFLFIFSPHKTLHATKEQKTERRVPEIVCT